MKTSSQGVISSNVANNSSGFCPAQGQKSGLYSRTGEPASRSLRSCIAHVIPVIALNHKQFQYSLTYFVFRVGCCFMFRSLTVLPVTVPVPCCRYMSHICRDTSVVNGEILYFLHRNGNIVFPLLMSCRAWYRTSFTYLLKGEMFMALDVTHTSVSTSERKQFLRCYCTQF